MPRIRKKTSKRISTHQRAKFKHKVAEGRKKKKKEAKKNPQWKSKKKKDPGIPNSFPYKDQILAEIAEARRQAEEAKHRRKEERKAAQAGLVAGGVGNENADEDEDEEEEGDDGADMDNGEDDEDDDLPMPPWTGKRKRKEAAAASTARPSKKVAFAAGTQDRKEKQQARSAPQLVTRSVSKPASKPSKPLPRKAAPGRVAAKAKTSTSETTNKDSDAYDFDQFFKP